MTVRTILKMGDPRLLRVAPRVTEFDTDALHLKAFNQVLGPRGHVFDHARFTRELQGFSNASIGARFLAEEPPTRQAAIIGEKEAAFRELVAGKFGRCPA